MKSNGAVHICEDYKITVNSALKQDKYPLTRIDYLFFSAGKRQDVLQTETLEQQQEGILDPIDIPCPSESTTPLAWLDEPATQQYPRNQELPRWSTRIQNASVCYGNPLPI